MERYYPSVSQLTFRFSHLSMSMNWRNEMLLFLYQNGGILEFFSFGSEKSGANIKCLFTPKILCFEFSMLIFKVIFNIVSIVMSFQ